MIDILSYYKGLTEIQSYILDNAGLDPQPNTGFADWVQGLPKHIQLALDVSQHGSLDVWFAVLNELPRIPVEHVDMNAAAIKVTATQPLFDEQFNALKKQLQRYKPWRKGPYDLHGVFIDSEWRSDWKWQRLEKHISPLKDRLVLDVGCGNGYHCWRMAGQGARAVIGIDPTMLYIMQYLVCQHFIHARNVFVLPLTLEALPQSLQAFDTVFSMGVLYHRRSPIDHLMELHNCLANGGELILETLVIDGEEGQTLMPQDRYARMRNVWFIPSCKTLITWLQRIGFVDVQCIDIADTSIEEQRITDWTGDASLQDFLDPNDPTKTVEGYPAPKRAIFRAGNRY